MRFFSPSVSADVESVEGTYKGRGDEWESREGKVGGCQSSALTPKDTLRQATSGSQYLEPLMGLVQRPRGDAAYDSQ